MLSFLLIALLWSEPAVVRVLKLSDAIPFKMGKVNSRRILHPDMGAKRITLNWAVSEPGHECPQHVHDDSDDTFLVLQGQVDVRQGDSRTPLLTGQAAFVPSKQIHGTITTGTGTAILISFQCPPDLALYSGARDSSRPGAAQPQGVITSGAVKLLNFSNKNSFFTFPDMGSKCVAAAHRTLQHGQHFTAESVNGGEEFLFVWKGNVILTLAGTKYHASERETVFIQGAAKPEVSNDSQSEAIVIQVQAPPASNGR